MSVKINLLTIIILSFFMLLFFVHNACAGASYISISNYTVDLSPDYDVAYDVAIDSNNDIIVVGYDKSPGDAQWRIMK
ncbi:MAG: hypothetical protein QMD36_06615, partial [Candidatus Aenigmarchaeota archaeon]|nr:hypothetical protein [Candidatus Aenigmarchaeota archaeon]